MGNGLKWSDYFDNDRESGAEAARVGGARLVGGALRKVRAYVEAGRVEWRETTPDGWRVVCTEDVLFNANVFHVRRCGECGEYAIRREG